MFSVVIITRESPGDLRRTLRSILSQLYSPRQVIVVERGSCADTDLVVAEFSRRSDASVLSLHRPGIGLGAACNLAAAHADGRYLTFLLARDEMLPLSLEHYAKHFRRHPEYLVCYGRSILRDRLGRLFPSYDKTLPAGDVLDVLFGGQLSIPLGAFACARGLFEEGMQFPNQGHGLEPLEFLLQLAHLHRFRCVQEDVIIVEETSDSLTPQRASAVCELKERIAEELPARINARIIAESLGKSHYAAAVAWWRAGEPERALHHVRLAREHFPLRMKYWFLNGLVRTSRWLPGPTVVPERRAA
ncbi:MAG: glycosyltransferase family A protein [Planctomycetota bacterium]